MYRYAIFVYGSLMEPNWRHDLYFKNIVAKGWGSVPGRLQLRHTGTPILEPDPESILCRGTADLMADCELQAGNTDPEKWKNHTPSTSQKPEVKGQWIICKDPDDQRLLSLDELEEFFPDRENESLYDRYLVKSENLPGPIWVYGVPKHLKTSQYIKPNDETFWCMKTEGVPRDVATGEWTGDIEAWERMRRG